MQPMDRELQPKYLSIYFWVDLIARCFISQENFIFQVYLLMISNSARKEIYNPYSIGNHQTYLYKWRVFRVKEESISPQSTQLSCNLCKLKVSSSKPTTQASLEHPSNLITKLRSHLSNLCTFSKFPNWLFYLSSSSKYWLLGPQEITFEVLIMFRQIACTNSRVYLSLLAFAWSRSKIDDTPTTSSYPLILAHPHTRK